MSNDDYTRPAIAGGPFKSSQVCEIHKELIEASIVIGSIAELAQWATMALAEYIATRHQSISSMTVGELVQIAEVRRHGK